MAESAGQGWDVVVVGSGAAGLTAACAAAVQGASVLLLEQAEKIGGTTAISGGMVWVPGNRKAAAAGRPDRLEAARTYLYQTVPGEERELLEIFLTQADQAVSELEAHTSVALRPVLAYPDYYPDLPGATPGGRVLEPLPFDGTELGEAFALLREPIPEMMLFGGMMIGRSDIPHLRRFFRSPRSAWHVAKLLFRHLRERLRAPRGTTLHLGNALVARLLKSALDLGVAIRTGTTVSALRLDANGRVSALRTLDQAGHRGRIEARRGVILATGGLSWDEELRDTYVPAAAGFRSVTVERAAPCGARLALALGAQLSEPTTQGAFWVPVSVSQRREGGRSYFPHTVADRAKPGLITVDGTGRRFVNGAVPYHEFVRTQLANERTAIPTWLLCDRRFLWKYGLGKIKPFALSVRREVASGYLKRAGSIAELARLIGVPGRTLAETLESFNSHARRGQDPAFGRGGDIYQRALGDPDHGPNPCVAPLEKPPFYAVAVYPADLGMSAGILTDGEARVLDCDGAPIPGLFACGNDMASVMAGAYPGPGITLGPALTFGWLAGKAAERG